MFKKFMRLLVVFSLCLFIVSCKSLQKNITSKDVSAINNKVADWQIKTFDDMGLYRALPPLAERKPWNNRNKHNELDWTCGALYSGMYEWGVLAGNNKYLEWLHDIARKNKFKLLNRMYHADDQAVGQLYLKLKTVYGDRIKDNQIKQRFDSILNDSQKDEMHWTWCDALFMAPPVWAKLAKQTGDKKYLDYMDSQYHKTYDLLWDKEESLFFRDKSYLNKKEANGKKIFWSRGNGWVFGGLALMIPDLPENWENKGFYIDIYKKMAVTLKNTQRKDGTWSSGILGGSVAYPTIETSGSAFFVYGLAWGINQKLLDKETYTPIMLKGWNALVKAVNKDGMLSYVQGIGAAPGQSYKDFTEVYGTGAFLAAGSEVYKFAQNQEAISTKKTAKNDSFTVLMKDGGWCWYQDPRVIIKNDKLIMGGLSGQSGDVKVGVYDLKTNTVEGSVVLDKNFQKDDHDVPALYARPDGSILAVWAKHAGEKIHHYNISSPTNYLEWGKPKQYVHDYQGNFGVTYMNLYYMQNENLLYNFFRDGPSFNPSFMTSSDQGLTWGNRNHFISDNIGGRQRPYARYFQKDANTIGVSFTDGHPRNYGNSLYYAEFKNGSFYNADGSKIKTFDGTPLMTTESEKIYKGSETKDKPEECESVPYSAWTCAMGKDNKNNPYIGYTLYINNNDHRFRLAIWDGSKWVDKEIAYAGKCLYYEESSYTGLMAFDPEDPSQVYISTDVNPSTGEFTGGTHEIYTAKIGINDDIKTLKWKAITSNSEYRNIRPIVVANEGHKVLLWLSGVWNSYENYNVDVKGLILK